MNLQYLDVNVSDIWGNAPLDHAVRNAQWSCAVLLMSQGGAHTLLLDTGLTIHQSESVHEYSHWCHLLCS
jgi:hypothetical protein